MASKHRILTDWPWMPLGSFKSVLLAPWLIHSVYSFSACNEEKRDLTHLLIFPTLLLRMLHKHIWVLLSRRRTAKSTRRSDRADKERKWDDQIVLNGVLFYIANRVLNGESSLPIWKKEGAIITILLHVGPVEFLYYWLRRALHRHYLDSRYHSHHRSSIVAEIIASVVHPFIEHIAYFLLFAIPLMSTVLSGTASMAAYLGYITFIDFMNNMGHCNFDLFPKSLFSLFPLLKYLIYTQSFRSMHHTKFRANFSLFLPFYDYIYGTMGNSSEQPQETSLQRKEEHPDVVHLARLTTPDSISRRRLRLPSLAFRPLIVKWYAWLTGPVTFCSIMLTWVYRRRLSVDIFRWVIWALPKLTFTGLLNFIFA